MKNIQLSSPEMDRKGLSVLLNLRHLIPHFFRQLLPLYCLGVFAIIGYFMPVPVYVLSRNHAVETQVVAQWIFAQGKE